MRILAAFTIFLLANSSNQQPPSYLSICNQSEILVLIVQPSFMHRSFHKEALNGQFRENQCELLMFIFPRRQQWYHLFGCETHANRAIKTRSWDYLVYLGHSTITVQFGWPLKQSSTLNQTCVT